MSTYSDLILSQTPALYLRLGEATGATTAVDLSANGYNGTYFNGPTLGVAGAIQRDPNTAVGFVGASNQRVNLGAVPNLRTNAAVTVSAWVYLNLSDGTQKSIIRVGDQADLQYDLYIINLTVGYVYHNSGSGYHSFEAGGPTLAANAWYHICFVRQTNGLDVTIYVNGFPFYSFTAPDVAEVNAAQTGSVGGDTSNRNMTGVLDEVAVFTTALTAAQVLQHFRTGVSAFASRYMNTILGDAPSLYLRLGEALNTSAYDASAHNLTGVYQATPTLGVTGAITNDTNTAVRLLFPASQYISVADNALLDPGDTFTLEAWINLTSTAGDDHIFNKGVGGYGLIVVDARQLVLTKAGTAVIVTSTSTIANGVWTHVVATKSGTTVKLYINSVDRTGTVVNATIVATANELQIGRESNEYFDGSIDEVAIYPTALSQAQVLSHYQAGVAALSAYATAVLADLPSLYLRLGEGGGTVAYDSSGNALDGTYINSPTLGLTGLVADPNTAASFLTASLQRVTVPNNTLLNPGDTFTLECWLRPTAISARRQLLDKGVNGYGLYLEAGVLRLGKVSVAFIADSIATVAIGQLAHCVATKSGATVKLYINGVDVTGLVTNQTIATTTSNLSIGAIWDGTGDYYSGTMDEVAIYPTALSATRVRAHYQAGMVTRTLYSNAVIGDAPKLYLRLGESEGPFAYDSTGTSPGTFVNGPTPGFAGPLVGDPNTAIGFIGTSNQRLSLVNSTIRTNLAITVEAWAYLTLNDGVDKVIFRCGIGADVQYMMQVKALAVGYVYHGATGFHTHNAGGPILTLNTWYHICLVRQSDGLTSTIYVNGAAYYTFTQIELAEVNLGQVGTVGGDIDAENYTGTLDEVAIYTTAFTRGQVLAHYRTGLSLNLYANAIIASGPLGDGPVLYMRFGESAGIIAFDSSGNNLHGTYINSPTLGVAGALTGDPNTAVGLVATSSQRIDVNGALLQTAAALSVEAWIYLTLNSGATKVIIRTGLGTDEQYMFFVANLTLGYEYYDGAFQQFITGSVLTLNAWEHVAFVRQADGKSITFYVNGVVVSTQTTTTVGPAAADQQSRIGGHPGQYFTGTLDELAVYTYPLSALQILARYRVGTGLYTTYPTTVLADGPSLYLRFGEQVGPTANDSSGNFLNGIYVNSPALGARGAIADDPNTAATFVAASLQYVTVADNNLLDPGDTFSLEMWVKPTSLAANMILIDKSSGSYSLILATTGTLTFFKNGGLNIAFSNVNLSVGQWYHVVVTKATATSKIYVNGVDQTTPQNVQVIVANAVALFIGASSSPNQYCNATLDEVALYPTALSAARVLAHYQAGTIARTNPGGGSGVNLSMTGIIRELTPEPIMSAETGGI